MRGKTGGPFLAGILQRMGLWHVPLLIGGVLFVRADHIPPVWRIVLLIPVVLFASTALWLLRRWVLARMEPGGRAVWQDGFALLCIFGGLAAVGIPYVLLLPLGCAFVFAIVQILRRRAGGFFVVFVGAALLLILFAAARLLSMEERFVLFAQHRLWAKRAEAVPRPAWAFDGDRRTLRVEAPDHTALVLDVPKDLSLHAPDGISLSPNLPAVGALVILLSGSSSGALATPLIAVFAPQAGQPHSPGEYHDAVLFALGHRRSQGKVLDPTSEGTTEERPPAPRATFFGISFGYRRPDGQKMREVLYVTTGPRGGQLVLFLRYARTPGFNGDPFLENLLRQARWETVPERGSRKLE